MEKSAKFNSKFPSLQKTKSQRNFLFLNFLEQKTNSKDIINFNFLFNQIETLFRIRIRMSIIRTLPFSKKT